MEKVEKSPSKGLYQLAAGLLWRDRCFLLLAYPILILSSILELFSDGFSFLGTFWFPVLGRLAQLIFLFLVTDRWIKQLSLDKGISGLRGLPFLLAFGFLIWAGLAIPGMVQLMALKIEERLFLLIILGPVLVFWFRYYFYFFPCVLGMKSGRSILAAARSFTIQDPYLPWRTLVGPAAISLLIEALIDALSPDGRMIESHYLKCLFAGTFWVLSTYLSLAAGLLYLPEKLWHEAKLDPYREGRLATIAISAPTLLDSLLSLKTGIKIIIVSLIMSTANFINLHTMPPAPDIKVEKISIRNNTVELALTLNDPVYKFRGFQPINLLLAGEQGAMVSVEPAEVIEEDTKKNLSFAVPRDKDQVKLTASFKTNRSGDNLKALQDLYLYYLGYKVTHLNMSTAAILPEAQAANPGEPPRQQ